MRFCLWEIVAILPIAGYQLECLRLMSEPLQGLCEASLVDKNFVLELALLLIFLWQKGHLLMPNS